MTLPPDIQKAFDEWLAGRPEIIQQLARKFPPGTTIVENDKTIFVVGYQENGSLLVSPVDPRVDYSGALDVMRSICPSCVEQLI